MLLLAGCGGSSSKPASTATGPAAQRPPRAQPGPVSPHGLATGLTEPNANLIWSAAARPKAPPGFELGRREANTLRPAFYRLVVDWAKVQPTRDAAPNWSLPDGGCMRTLPPCAPFAGVREQLAAVASQQKAVGGYQVLVVLQGSPDWAASPPAGCERRGLQPRARVPAPGALAGYRRLIASLERLGREQGVALQWWSPWNEPNHPVFFNPQRGRCNPAAPSLSPPLYTKLAEAMAAELRRIPGPQHMVLGELAGLRPGPRGTGATEFIAALPKQLLCGAPVWAQHAYVGGEDLVAQVEQALVARGCPHTPHIWLTETGAGAPHAGFARSHDPGNLRASCERLHATLVKWRADPLIDVAFQYTFREDDQFPVGLMTTGLDAAYPTLGEWRAWGGKRAPDDPAPALSCGPYS